MGWPAPTYYLAKNHGIHDVCVVEAGWIGGGNTERNTTIVRSNHLCPQSARLYDFSERPYEQLAAELNFNLMFSQRGVLTLMHSRHDLDAQSRWANAMMCNGIDVEQLDATQARELEPRLDFGDAALPARWPIVGGFIQRRAGSARHDAVAWGHARAASALGVDIVQNCPVTGFVEQGGRVAGVVTPRGEIRADKVALAVAGHSSVPAVLAGLQLPVTSRCVCCGPASAANSATRSTCRRDTPRPCSIVCGRPGRPSEPCATASRH